MIAARARNPAGKPGRRRRLCLLPKSVSARHLPGMPPLGEPSRAFPAAGIGCAKMPRFGRRAAKFSECGGIW